MQTTSTIPLRPRLQRGNIAREVFETILLIGLTYTLVNLASVRFFIEGPSMQPSFHNDQYLIVSRIHYLIDSPHRGDVVVFDAPGDDEQAQNPLLIKRLIGMPGETITFREGQLYIDGQLMNEPYIKELCTSGTCQDRTWEVGAGQYFLMGDNRNNSRDSRVFGTVTKDRIIGEAIIRYWPPQDWGSIVRYRYPEG